MSQASTSPALKLTLGIRSILSVTQAGGSIFSGTSKSGQSVRVVARHSALPRLPLVGECWEIEGEYRTHAKFGEQLHALRCMPRLPHGELIVEYLARNSAFAGIGHVKARALYDAFGKDLVAVLNAGDASALKSVLTADAAAQLCVAWAGKRVEGDLVAFLDEHGFDQRLSNKIRRAWGDRAKEMLERNPYFMLAFAGWVGVDRAAAKLAIKDSDDRRLVGAVEAVLYERLQQCHTLTDHESLTAGVAKKLQSPVAATAIQLALSEGAMVGAKESGYQAFGAAALERGISQRIRAMIDGEATLQRSLIVDTTLTPAMLASRIRAVGSGLGIALNAEQHEAVTLAVTRRFSLLTGGAGVGKTTVLRVVIEIAESLGLAIIQMALAGRAAKRMAEATGKAATTIAKFLMSARAGSIDVHPDTLLIVDEASMLDLPTMGRILKCLPDGIRLLLVGDPAQLPPIGFGLVFHRLAESASVPMTHLRQVHRQAASSGIPAIAQSIREHRLPRMTPFEGRRAGVSIIECAPEQILGNLIRVTDEWTGDDWQIVGATRSGSAGNDAINWTFHERNAGDVLPGWQFAVGDPVIHLMNDYDLGLMNGTLGRIKSLTETPETGLTVDFEGDVHFIPASQLAERIELAYSITVHKAQGSQFRRVAVPVVKSKILDHALIYTALTRAVEQVVFIGDADLLLRAVESPSSAQRRSVAFRV